MKQAQRHQRVRALGVVDLRRRQRQVRRQCHPVVAGHQRQPLLPL